MAGDWIKWVKGLDERREVLAIARALRLDAWFVATACMKIWSWADDNTTTGHIAGATIEDIDRLVRIPGFGSVLATVGWLDVRNDGIQFPRWERHNSQSAKKRALDSERKSAKRRQNVRQMSASKADTSSLLSSTPVSPSGETKRNGHSAFIRPTVEEVRSYCAERGNQVDAQQFVDFYESKGWKVGDQSMKDWKAAVRTWEKREQQTSLFGKTNGNGREQERIDRSFGAIDRAVAAGLGRVIETTGSPQANGGANGTPGLGLVRRFG